MLITDLNKPKTNKAKESEDNEAGQALNKVKVKPKSMGHINRQVMSTNQTKSSNSKYIYK